MKVYLACLLVFASWSGVVLSVERAIAESKPTTATKVISPAAALDRLITAKQLKASWFTPALLKEMNIEKIQFQRDVSLKLGSMRYGNYKSVQPIGRDKYRIIFDRAEPDAVIALFKVDTSGRIMGIQLAEKNKPEPNAQAQAAAGSNVDRSFRTNVGSNGKPNKIFVSLKQWLGNYQKAQKKDATNYTAIFDRGSVPVVVNFKTDGSIENYSIGCPVTKSLPLSKAPPDLQKLFSQCPNLK